MSTLSDKRSDRVAAENAISDASTGEPQALDPEEAIAGDRGIPPVNRTRSIQSRVSQVLAIGLMSALGLGLLTWYYAKTLTRPVEARHAAQASVKNRAQGEMALPAIPHVASPYVREQSPPEPPAPSESDSTSAVEKLLGSAPPPPGGAMMPPIVGPAGPPPQAIAANAPREVTRRACLRAPARGARVRARVGRGCGTGDAIASAGRRPRSVCAFTAARRG